MAAQEPSVGWVKPATPITGLDHLGSVAPCIAIYSTLLPGITNVTDRARYYSFYPWFLWKYSQVGEPIESAHFHDLYRRADCLFTLIAEAHSSSVGDDPDRHGSRMVGRDKLVPALRELTGAKSLRLSDFATQDPGGRRYFKNRLGGLGQYYVGTLEELGILAGRKGEYVQYDATVGADIARRFDTGVPGDEFWATLKRDTVNARTLARLAPFCPCELKKNTSEYSWLTDLFLARSGGDEQARIRRRRSLGLILHFTRAIAADSDSAVDPMTFREACYSGSLPNGSAWALPDSLVSIRDDWHLYQRNEFLSVAAQALLTIFVRALELMQGTARSPEEVATRILEESALRRPARLSWRQFLDDCRKKLPPLGDTDNPVHELNVIERLFDLRTADGPMPILAEGVHCALLLMAALQLRAPQGVPPYGDLPITDALLADYPINLCSLTRVTAVWNAMSVGQVVEWLLREWACETHLRIALRKLRNERLDTFRFHPTEGGLKPREVPPYVYSNPRVRQGIQILRDLGALEANDERRLKITKSGALWLEEICRS